MKDRDCLRCAGLLWAVGAVLGLGPGVATAHEPDRERHPGFVDGSPLVELAGEDGGLVEVSIHGGLLRQVSSALSRRNEHIGSFLGQIVSIHAVIIEDVEDSEEAGDRMHKMAKNLEEDDWERLARVRESGSDVWVFVLQGENDNNLDGLTVLVNEGDELVFVNLAGRIDLELISEFGFDAGIPGLGRLSEYEFDEAFGDYEKQRRKKSGSTSGGKSKKKKKSKKEHRESSSSDGRSEG